ncbi:hypothetical protein C8Q74DRAFT_24329 [Fomes fomentarius]|nr:hypothetical protein C8Q74DRAFT_24329 [Fomes fomentarius]
MDELLVSAFGKLLENLNLSFWCSSPLKPALRVYMTGENSILASGLGPAPRSYLDSATHAWWLIGVQVSAWASCVKLILIFSKPEDHLNPRQQPVHSIVQSSHPCIALYLPSLSHRVIMPPIPASFQHTLGSLDSLKTKYNLDISGVVGFFGGDVAVAAMSSVHICRYRRWLGWYNSPGSYDIAKSYGVLARARLWDGIYPGENVEPAELFRYTGKQGPAFYGVRSKIRLSQTGHLGYLLMQECENHVDVDDSDDSIDIGLAGHRDAGGTITVVELDRNHIPELISSTTPAFDWSTFLVFIPIITSFLTCSLCVIVANDWVCFSLILFGTVTSGLSCMVIGSGDLRVTRPAIEPESEARADGSGILNADGSNVVIVMGGEVAVSTITQGNFSLDTSRARDVSAVQNYHRVGFCALLLTTQFLAQLLLIPLGSLFGQLMFLTSLGVSWLYTITLSIDRNHLQQNIVDSQVFDGKMKRTKYAVNTRTAMVIHVLLTLHDSKHINIQEQSQLKGVLELFFPSSEPIMMHWREMVLRQFNENNWPCLSHLDTPSPGSSRPTLTLIFKT